MKKILVSTSIALLLLIVLASMAFAAPTAVEKQLLLKGSLQAVETGEVNFPTLFVDATGSGNATQLGRFTVSFQVEVNLPTLSGPASATFVGANGDSLYAEGWGQSAPTGTPNVITIVETYTITGGTGRFAGATGNFRVERLINRATFASSGTISGTILIP